MVDPCNRAIDPIVLYLRFDSVHRSAVLWRGLKEPKSLASDFKNLSKLNAT